MKWSAIWINSERWFNPLPLFIPLALGFGTLLVFLTPPFQSPDEYNHFFRAWQISSGGFYPEKISDNRLGGHLPRGLDSLKRVFLPLKGNYEAKTNWQELQNAGTIRCTPANSAFIDFPNTAIYAPTAYIPQVSGIFLARMATDRVLFILYAARMANLLCWIGLASLALRQMTFLKQSIAYLFLLPATLAIAASCSADVFTNGLAFYFVGLCSRVAADPTRLVSTASGRLAIFCIPVILAVNKLVLAPFALLPVAFQVSKKWRATILYGAIPGIIAIGFALWWGSTAEHWFIAYDQYDSNFRDRQTLNPGVNPPAQLDFILHQPVFFIKTVIGSFWQAVPSLAAHLVGKFGWEKNYLPAWMLGLLWLALGTLLFCEKNPLNRAQRLKILGIVLICMALWAVTMYALWCPVGAAGLDNWQGRYFLALAPLLLLVFGTGLTERWNGWVGPGIVLTLLGSNSTLIYSILMRYYL